MCFPYSVWESCHPPDGATCITRCQVPPSEGAGFEVQPAPAQRPESLLPTSPRAEEIPTGGPIISEETDKMSGEEMKDPLRLDDRHKCVMCEARLGSKEELQEHFRLHANSQIDMKGRKAVNAVKPIVKQVIFKKMTFKVFQV